MFFSGCFLVPFFYGFLDVLAAIYDIHGIKCCFFETVGDIINIMSLVVFGVISDIINIMSLIVVFNAFFSKVDSQKRG